MYKHSALKKSWTISTMPVLMIIFFVSGFTALLYQVVWQRMLGLFSGSDVRSVTIVVTSYLLGLGLGSLLGSFFGDRLSRRKAIQVYGCCNFGIAAFAVLSRFLFYDLLFQQLKPLAQSNALMLLIVLLSLLIPTTLMGVSLPLIAKATSQRADQAAPRIGLLYGMNTLGSGLGTLLSGWYLVGTLGYERTIGLGAILSALVGIVALSSAVQFDDHRRSPENRLAAPKVSGAVFEWGLLVFCSGFAAISLEIIWFRVLDTILQSIAYTYAHLLAFILVGNALGSVVGAAMLPRIHNPRRTFLLIQAGVAAYSIVAIWLVSVYWQLHPTDLQVDIGYINPHQISPAILFKYVTLPLLLLVPPNFLLGFYFPVVQKAIQTDDHQIGQRVGFIQVANILGNATGCLLTGLVLLDQWGTAAALRLLAVLGLGFVLLTGSRWLKANLGGVLAVVLIVTVAFFPGNRQLWAALHGIRPQQYFIVAEDSTGVAAVTETQQQGILLASGQAQARFPYMEVHALLGSLPALIHPQPRRTLIIGLGSGGTAHTAGVNPLTEQIRVVELLGAELKVLHQYAQMPAGRALQALFQDRRYEFVVGDGRRELELTDQQFDIIEADAIYPWRSRAGMLYSQEFFQAVRSHLAPGGLFVEWNAGLGVAQTFRNVFPSVTQLALGKDLYVLIGSEQPVEWNPAQLLTKLENPTVLDFLAKAEVDVNAIRRDVQSAKVKSYVQSQDGQPDPFNTDLFPRSEYYLNQSSHSLAHS